MKKISIYRGIKGVRLLANRLFSILFPLFTVLLLPSCEYKDLCYTHPHSARLRIDVDWSESQYDEEPNGMSVMVMPTTAGGSPTETHLSNDITHVDLSLFAGTYDVMAYNQSPSEFGTLTFTGMDSINTAMVYANALDASSTWYTPSSGEQLLQEPEWIAAGVQRSCTVTEEMVEQCSAYNEVNSAGWGTGQPNSTAPRFLLTTVYPQSLVYTIYVTVHLKGAHNLRSARAALTDLADGNQMAYDRPTTSTGTQLLEGWTLTKDKGLATTGTIQCSIKSFGLPTGHSGAADANTFNLSMLLVDGKTKVTHTFQVGNLFRYDSDPSKKILYLDLYLDEALPDVKPEGAHGGGFDAEVDEWGPEDEIIIKI